MAADAPREPFDLDASAPSAADDGGESEDQIIRPNPKTSTAADGHLGAQAS